MNAMVRLHITLTKLGFICCSIASELIDIEVSMVSAKDELNVILRPASLVGTSSNEASAKKEENRKKLVQKGNNNLQ